MKSVDYFDIQRKDNRPLSSFCITMWLNARVNSGIETDDDEDVNVYAAHVLEQIY